MKKFRKLAAAFLAVLMLVGVLPISASADGDKLIALTFDDGPSSSNTARLLDGLKARARTAHSSSSAKWPSAAPALSSAPGRRVTR